MKRIGKNETTEINTVKKCFVALEAALYLLFLALDAFSTGGDGVKYLTIVVCLLAAAWSAQHGGSCLMAWAMVFTLAADTFLLLLDRWYGAGIVLFCVVQGLYLARIRRACGRTLWVLRAGLVAAAWVLLSALGMGTALNLLAALYFVNFLVNAFQSLTLTVCGGTVAVSAVRRMRGAAEPAVAAAGSCRGGAGGDVAVLSAGTGAAGAVRLSEAKGEYDMKEAKRLWSWLAIPCIALAVLTGSILPVLLVREFYTVQIGPLGICEASGLTGQQAAEAYGDVMDYCMGRRPDFSAGVLPFSAEGASHFADVRGLFRRDCC